MRASAPAAWWLPTCWAAHRTRHAHWRCSRTARSWQPARRTPKADRWALPSCAMRTTAAWIRASIAPARWSGPSPASPTPRRTPWRCNRQDPGGRVRHQRLQRHRFRAGEVSGQRWLGCHLREQRSRHGADRRSIRQRLWPGTATRRQHRARGLAAEPRRFRGAARGGVGPGRDAHRRWRHGPEQHHTSGRQRDRSPCLQHYHHRRQRIGIRRGRQRLGLAMAADRNPGDAGAL